MAKRYKGYGHIAKRNTEEGGQLTNCRINHLLLHEFLRGTQVDLLFRHTHDRFNLESYLIERFSPEWNRTAGKNLDEKCDPADLDEATGSEAGDEDDARYDALRRYLSESANDVEILSLRLIEDILGRELPPSAFRYRTWWGNGGHVQAKAWMSVGWRVERFGYGRYLVFAKKPIIYAG